MKDWLIIFTEGAPNFKTERLNFIYHSVLCCEFPFQDISV